MKRYVDHMRKFGGPSQAQYGDQSAKINAQFQMKFVLDMCRENNLALYTATQNNVFVRAT